MDHPSPEREPIPFPPPDMIALRELVARFDRAWTPPSERLRQPRPARPIDPHDASDPAWRWLVKMGE